MKYELPPSYLWTFVFLLACWLPSRAQVAIGSAGAARESFNAMGSGTALPAHWKMSAAGDGANASWSNGSNVSTLTGAAHSGTPAMGGRYNWGTAEGTDRAVGFMSDGSYSSPNAILVRYQNKTGAAVSSFTVTFQVERYRINTSPFSLTFSTSTNDAAYTARSEGAVSSAVFAGGASAYSFSTPQTVYKTLTITENIPVDGSIYLRWVFTSIGNASQGLGLDNVTLSLNTTTPLVSATLTDALTTDVNNNSKANEGDKLTYTTTISSTGKDATDVQYNAPLDANTTLSGAVKTSAIAIEDNFATPFNTPLTGANVSLNDFGLPAKTVVSFGTTEFAVVHLAGSAGTTDNGGTLTVHANGSFTYTPPTGFTGYDRFSYALQAGVAPNDVGMVTIAVGNAPTAGEAESFPGVIGNVRVSNAPSLLSNDAGDGIRIGAVNGNASFVGTPTTTTQGGNVTINADGTFTYNPAAGYTGTDNFTYTIDNGFSSPVTVTVPITVSGMIWFVNNAAPAGGDGRLSSPFNALAGVSNGGGGSGDNQTIFVYSGSGNYTGGIVLKNGQKLIGQGATASLASLAGVTIPSYSPALPGTGGSNPVIENASGNGLTLAQNNTLRGFNLGNASGNALSGSGFGTLNVSEVAINTTGQAVALSTGTLAGSFTGITSTGGARNVSFSTVNSVSTVDLGDGAMSGATGSGFYILGGNLSLSYAGNITNSTATANEAMVFIVNHTGTITFNSGTLHSTGRSAFFFSEADGTYHVNGTTTATGNSSTSLLIQSGSSGIFNFSSGTAITNPNGLDVFSVLQSSPTITYNGSITRSSGDGYLVRVTSVAGGTITFQNGTLSATSGFGLVFDNADGTVNFNGTTTLNGGDAGIDILNGSDGTFVFASGTAITNPISQVININNSSAALTFSGTFSKSNAGQGISITNSYGTKAITINGTGTKSLSTQTGNAINITGNSAGTSVNFSGNNLTLITTSGTGLHAIGGGTISVQGTGNTIAATGGIALNVANTTIGAGGLNFQSISANGAPNGIVLNNTGSSGGLTVLGTGTANSGGTIQNTTGDGISLTSTQNPSFTRMNIQSTGGNGVYGTGVTNFTFTNGTINNSGTSGGVDNSNINLGKSVTFQENNVSGTVTITGNTFSNPHYHGVDIFNWAGLISYANVSNNTITAKTGASRSFGSAIRLIARGEKVTSASVTRANLDNNTVQNAWQSVGIQAQGGHTGTAPAVTFGIAGHSTNFISISGNTLTATAIDPLNAEGILAVHNHAGQANFRVNNNGTAALPIGKTKGTAISVSAFGQVNVTAEVNGNYVSPGNIFGSQGIGVGISNSVPDLYTQTTNFTVSINNNTISQTDGVGIWAVSTNTAGLLKVSIKNNNVAAPLDGPRPGIRIDAGRVNGNSAVCLDISGNTSAGNGMSGIGLRKQGTDPNINKFGIVGMAATSSPAVEAYVSGLNPSGGGTLLISATSGFSNCSTSP